MKKRLLILSLGSGQILDSGKPKYIETQYIIEGIPYSKDGIPKKSNYVADPIISNFVPDEIFILGTVKSLWYQFYSSITTKDNSDESYINDANYQRLLEIVRNNGVNTSSDQLESFSNEISDIFATIDSWDKYNDTYKNKKPDVHILLTKYGINKEELVENYGILKKIEDYLQYEYEYEVAFDITLSFRSLPIYNLIIFNYIKNITKFRLSIKHIYYGNVDVRFELNNQAPLVDLADLSHVLDLTSGVTEFKDTGNAVSLLKLIDENDPIKNELERFDLATQLNIVNNVRDEMDKLLKLVKLESSDARYTGIREMIQIIFDEKFFEKEEGESPKLSEINEIDFKYMLTKWYFNQNRIGLGLATGLEALRDINTPPFMETRGNTGLYGRQDRENAESYFIKIAEDLRKKEKEIEKEKGKESSSDIASPTQMEEENNSKESQLTSMGKEKSSKNPILTSMVEEKNPKNSILTPTEKAVCNLGCKLRHYKDIRNIFAHSLTKKEAISIELIKEDIENFKQDFITLKESYDADPEAYKALFIPRKATTTTTTKPKSKNCRIILNIPPASIRDEHRKSKTGVVYDVYCLPDKVRNYIFGYITKPKDRTAEKAETLVNYLHKNMPTGYENIQIILHDIKDTEKTFILRLYLEKLCKDDDRIKLFHDAGGSIKPLKKTRIEIVTSDETGHDKDIMEEAIQKV